MQSVVSSHLTRISMVALRAALVSSPVLLGLACGSSAQDGVVGLGELSNEVISKTPVASWSFEQCDGTVYSGPGAQNGVGCAYGPRRFTAKFDGSNDQIVMTDQASYRFSTAMTMSAWVRPASTTNTRAIVNKWSSTNAYKLDISGGKYRYSLALTDGTTETISATASAAVGAWAHVTATFTGTQMALYVNGTQVASKPLSPSKTIQSSTQPIRIGVEGTTNRFVGRIDEVRLYNAALTAAEVKELAGFVPGASAPKARKILFAVYDPVLANGQKLSQARGWFDPKDQIQDIVTSLKLASGGYADYQIAETRESGVFPPLQDGFTYNESTYNQCMDDPEHASCHTQSDFDFAKMFNDYGICSKLQSGAIHEVMIFSAPYFQTDEFAFKIPANKMPYNQPTNEWLYDMRKKNIPDCGKTVFVMGYNYERDLGNAVHSYGHRMESALALTVGRGFWDGCIGHNGVPTDFDKFTCIKKNITPSTPVQTSGPGNVHFPPNGLSDYDYGNTTNATDNSPSWANYPFTSQTTVSENCNAWGCEQNGYIEWWLGKLPVKDGVTSNGNLKNWWKYGIDYDAALTELGIGGGTDAGTPPPVDSGSGGGTCKPAYSQSNCLTYVQGTIVSSGGHNWLCSNGNCANCATFTSCAPGGSGCPWGIVWTDQGTCQ